MKPICWMIGMIVAVSAFCADPIAERSAWMKKYYNAKDPMPVLRAGMKSKDAEIQAKAAYEYFQIKKDAAFPELVKLANKSSEQLAKALIVCAEHMKDPKKKTELLQKIAYGTFSAEAAKEANRKNFNFHRINVRFQDRKDVDFNVEKIKVVKIPENRWKVIQDKDATGHLDGYYKPEYNDSKWSKGGVKTLKYQPMVWYRIRFKGPKKLEHNAVELHFSGLESAGWIWLNGIYIGCRDEGPKAWNKPFALDITKELRWEKENVLVVRVSSTDIDSGIYKPITLEILK